MAKPIVFDNPLEKPFAAVRHPRALTGRRRTVFVAATYRVDSPDLRAIAEPRSASLWGKRLRMRLWRAFRRLTR